MAEPGPAHEHEHDDDIEASSETQGLLRPSSGASISTPLLGGKSTGLNDDRDPKFYSCVLSIENAIEGGVLPDRCVRFVQFEE